MKSFLMFCSAATCALAFASFPAAAQTAATPGAAPVAELVKRVDIPYEQFTLPNGLRVVVHTDRKAPVVAVSVWYDVGSKMEPAGKTGFAHLFEHLMFNGSQNSPGDFFEPLQQVGATDFNGTTWFDRTNYFETVPTPALERALFLESDRMGWLLPAMTQAKLDNQRGVVQNEKRQGDNEPYGLVEYAELDNLFPEGHPYHHSTIGSMADLDKASLEDVKQWFRDHYGPNNAVLVLAGDVDARTARPLVEKYFGAIKPGPKGHDPVAPVPTLPARKDIALKDNVATTRIYREWIVPGLNDPATPALDVASDVLGGLASSRLDNMLVRKEQLAVGVTANLQQFEQMSMFEVTADVRPGVDPATVSKRLDEIINEFIAKGPSADEVQRVVTTQVAGRIRGLEQVGGFGGKAVALAEGALYSNDPGFYKKQLAALAGQTPATVKAAMQKWLTRPVLAMRVDPGQREAYQEAAAPEAKPAAATAATEATPAATRTMPAVGEIGDLDFPAVTRTQLSNHIELVYAQRTAVPITQAVLSFDAGATADRADKPGTQALMLSLLDEGTKTRDSIAIAEQRERLGALIGTASSADRTSVTLNTPSPNLAPSLELFADVVRNPAFAPDEVSRLKNQQLAGIQGELKNPNGLASRALPPLVFGESPYAKLGAGSGDPAAVASLTPADLAAFHDAWLRPDKAKIFVVSDRPLAEVKAAFEARFGDWKGTGEAGVKPTAPATQAPDKILLVDRPDSPQSVILGGQLTGRKGTDEMLDFLAANDVLGGNFLARINMDLRESKGWSYGSYGVPQRYEGALAYVIQAPVQADRTGDSIRSLRQDVTEFLTTKGISDEEFARTITGSVRELSGSFETSGDVLGAMQRNDLFHRSDDYYDTIAQRYRALTREQLDAAARATLKPDRFVWVVVGDAAKVKPQLEGLGLPVEVVPAASLAGRSAGASGN